MKRVWTIGLAQLAFLTAIAVAPALAADKVKMSLAATDDVVYLPFFVAVDKGYYRQLDLDVEIVSLGGGIATPALLSGRLDFSTSTASATSAILSGAKLKIVMTLSESVPWKLWSARPEIKTLHDLKGKAVGVQTRGDLFELSMRALLMRAGLPEDFVAYVPLGFGNTQRLGIIQSGSLPAVLLTNFEEKIARERGALGRARMLVDISKEIPIPNNGLATSDRLLQENPSVVERVARGTLMGMRYIKARREATLRIFAKRVPDVSLDVLRESIDETAAVVLENGTASLSTQKAEIALRSSMMGQSQQVLPPGKVFDYSVVVQAAEHLRATKWVPTE
jgi:ABC-type nitrate/sulfonate/bicarbonate transport system substrate-binding protein